MHKDWKGKNVDLGLLTSRIGDFFKTKDFQAIKGEIPTGYQILAEDSPHFKISGYVSAAVEGTPNDFVVKFDLCAREKKRSLPYSMFLETMFLGGYFLSRRLKSDEAWLKLEKEFWRYAENAVLRLSNSAKDSAQSLE